MALQIKKNWFDLVVEVKWPLEETTLERLVVEEEVSQVNDDLRGSPTVTTDGLDAPMEEEETATDIPAGRPVVLDSPDAPAAGVVAHPGAKSVPSKWLTPGTLNQIARALGEFSNQVCRECGQECSSRK